MLQACTLMDVAKKCQIKNNNSFQRADLSEVCVDWSVEEGNKHLAEPLKKLPPTPSKTLFMW